MTYATNDVFTLDHFQRALGDVSDLHYDDLHETPYMNVATRLYLTAGVAVRFASKRAKYQCRHGISIHSLPMALISINSVMISRQASYGSHPRAKGRSGSTTLATRRTETHILIKSISLDGLREVRAQRSAVLPLTA